MYSRFGITLMLTHSCNLRCTYCYTGAKVAESMSFDIGCAAIDRAIASLSPRGWLELGFFGGEPLLEAAMLARLVEYARRKTRTLDMNLLLSMTTNGTVTGPRAWSVMMMPDMELAISCDGTAETHDRHRLTVEGRGTSGRVLATMRRLVAAHKDFWAAMVVRPDTVEALPENIAFLQELGVRRICPSLDVWTRWSTRDIARLEQIVGKCARLWRLGLPDLSISWFDEKAGLLARLDGPSTSRCGFGDGEIAVAPSGRLYACERLIGDDADDTNLAILGHVLDGVDFLNLRHSPQRDHSACDACAMQFECNTTCRCSNYVRTGDVSKPDGLLCAFNQACLVEAARSLNEPVAVTVFCESMRRTP